MSAKTGLPSKAVGGLWALALQGSAYGIVIEKMEVLSRILVCAQCDKEHRPELMYLTWGVGLKPELRVSSGMFYTSYKLDLLISSQYEIRKKKKVVGTWSFKSEHVPVSRGGRRPRA